MAGRSRPDAEDDTRCAGVPRPTARAGRAARASGTRRRSRPAPQPTSRRVRRLSRAAAVDRRRADPRCPRPRAVHRRPGSRRQVLDLVGLLETVPFDPQRSPWDVTVIDGLAGGGAAMYVRAHHVLTDGVAGLRLLGLLLDEPAGRAPNRTRTPYTPPPALAIDGQTSARSARSRSPSTLRRRSAALFRGSVPPASSIRWRRRWVACSARWTSPTPCPVSSSSPEGRSPHARPVARCCRASS